MACSSGGAPRRPATDAILVILTSFCAIRTLPTACENRNVPVRLVSMTLFQCSRRISSTGAPQEVPALLIKTSILPNSETAASTTSWTLPGFFTSQPSARVLTPSSRNSSAARSRSEEHTSELQSHLNLVCRLLLETQMTTSSTTITTARGGS